jgi:hypothetical protein
VRSQTTDESFFALGPQPPDRGQERIWLAELTRTELRGRPAAAAFGHARLAADLTDRQVAVARSGDGWAFAAVRRMVHPLTHDGETSVTRFAATSPAAASALLAGLGERELLDRCSTEVDAAPDARQDALAAHGFVEQVLVLRREVATVPVGGDPELDIHPVRPEEAGFVVDCLATALRRGLGDADPAVDLAGWARTRYRLADPDTICLVGTVDGRPACHGLGYRRADRHGSRSVLYLTDVFVLPEHHSRGFSRTVTAAMACAAAEAGYEVLESDVVLRPDSAALRAGLSRAGWTEDRIRWMRG